MARYPLIKWPDIAKQFIIGNNLLLSGTYKKTATSATATSTIVYITLVDVEYISSNVFYADWLG